MSGSRDFTERLKDLQAVIVELVHCGDSDGLILQAVKLGREVLGFDRIGIWLVDQKNQCMRGTFGTDENGNIRDERHERHSNIEQWGSKMEGQYHYRYYPDDEVRNSRNEVIGRADHATSPLWNGEEVVGFIAVDQFLTRRKLEEHDRILLSYYASYLAHIITMKRNESERSQLERQVQEAQKLESLGVLAGGIAHDFNNLLAGILGNVDLALDTLPKDCEARVFVEEIQHSGERAAELCSQMLAYSGRGKFVVQSMDLSHIVHEIEHLLQISISRKASLFLDCAEHLPVVDGDAAQIRQIIMNLITNASDALGDEAGTITVRTGAVSCDDEYLKRTFLDDPLPAGVYVFLEVSDTGCGMDRDTVKRVFEPFFTTKFTGRGLGMAAVLGIIRGHKGAIKVYSEPGQGSCFKIFFPASGPPQEACTAPEREPAALPIKGEGTVLVADDEPAVLDVAEQILTSMGFKVLRAGNGEQALEIYHRHADEIVCAVLDLTMPRMDGEETFRRLRDLDPEIPVVLSSGYTEHDAIMRFGSERPCAFIQKPFRARDFRSTIACAFR